MVQPPFKLGNLQGISDLSGWKVINSPLHPFSYMYYIVVIKKLIDSYSYSYSYDIFMLVLKHHQFFLQALLASPKKHQDGMDLWWLHVLQQSPWWWPQPWCWRWKIWTPKLQLPPPAWRDNWPEKRTWTNKNNTLQWKRKSPPKKTYIWCDANVADSWKKLGEVWKTILNSSWVMSQWQCLVPCFHQASVKLNSTAMNICNGISWGRDKGALDLDLGWFRWFRWFRFMGTEKHVTCSTNGILWSLSSHPSTAPLLSSLH